MPKYIKSIENTLNLTLSSQFKKLAVEQIKIDRFAKK